MGATPDPGTRRLLVDTSYLLAHWNAHDAHHERSLQVDDRFLGQEWDGLILLDVVFTEAVNVLQARVGRQTAKEFGDTVLHGEEFTWLHLGDRMEEVWQTFLRRPDDGLSLVETAIVTVAESLGIRDVATFDKGFDAVEHLRRVP